MLTYAPNSFMGMNLNSPTIQGILQQNNQPQFNQQNMGIYGQQNMYGQQIPFQQPQQIGNIGMYGYNNGVNPYMNQPQFNQQNMGIYGQQNNQLQFNNPYYQNQIMNGGYYSGFYGYDPQLIRQQMEEQKKLQEQMLRNSIAIKKLKAKIYNTYYGIEMDDDYDQYLDDYYNPNTYAEINKDLGDYEEMRRLSEISNDPAHQIGPNYNAINNVNKLSQHIREMHPIDQSFVDFMNTAGDAYREALINDNIRELKKNIANTYDREAYHQLANMHRNSFASLRQNVSVDDLSISLPAHLRGNKEYEERKNQFLSYITQHDVRNRGGS